MDRRQFLASVGSVGAAAVAGCTATAQEVPPPRLSERLLKEGGWEQTADIAETVFEREYAGVTVSASQHTVQYADRALRGEIADRTLGTVDTDLAVLFATRVNFSPDIDNLPAGVGRGQLTGVIRENARSALEAQLENAGLENVRDVDSGTMTVDTGETADVTRLAADYVFEGMSFPVTEDRSVEIEGDAIRVDGMIATWHHGDYVILAGGAHPGENFERTISKELSDGIRVTVEIDMKLDPEGYAAELERLVKSVA